MHALSPPVERPRWHADARQQRRDAVPGELDNGVIDTPLARTQGQISRTFTDSAGTRWIEHTAPVKPGSSGGPLVYDDVAVGVNTRSEYGITAALEIAPFFEWAQAAMQAWRERQQRSTP